MYYIAGAESYHTGKQKPFTNINIRRALALAVNRNDMPMVMPAYGFVPWTLFGSKAQYRSEISDSPTIIPI